ncbi:response regulator transcription factor [Leifsonia aquatica]|uniref:DNA-binding response OmpR family regulator n=1 Tax=Leifsonia aquatica TaxID=144185 RepID=A0A7W4YKX8_LEIAQ|nr:response regulator transcription factor [Leifsonia aquatica]MBB2968932.1 DNA-binding response OmpR family regulator [Leifsonia aquatica]
MTEKPQVLVAEDDSRLAGMLTELLESEGYDVSVAADGQRALHLSLTQPFDVFILDRGLPVLDGMDVLRRIRQSGLTVPVLVLSALGNAADRVEGLDGGAEDYLAKPFDIDELLARLRVLRRRGTSSAPTIRFTGGVLDANNRTVILDGGERTVLSERESALLEQLARRPTQVFSRAMLLETVFADADDPGVVDTYVHHLRRKFGRTLIETVRGLGYRMGAL